MAKRNIYCEILAVEYLKQHSEALVASATGTSVSYEIFRARRLVIREKIKKVYPDARYSYYSREERKNEYQWYSGLTPISDSFVSEYDALVDAYNRIYHPEKKK